MAKYLWKSVVEHLSFNNFSTLCVIVCDLTDRNESNRRNYQSLSPYDSDSVQM